MISLKLIKAAIQEFWLIAFNYTWHRWSVFVPASHFSEHTYYKMWGWVNTRLETPLSRNTEIKSCLEEGITEAERLFLISKQNQRPIVQRQELVSRLQQIRYGLSSVYRSVPRSVFELNMQLVLGTETEPAKDTMIRLGVNADEFRPSRGECSSWQTTEIRL